MLVLATTGCERTPPPEPPRAPKTEAELKLARWNWSVFSPDTRARLTQEAVRADLCKMTCARDEKTVWSEPGCFGRVDDFVFVSNDCERALVLFEYPERADPWEATVVARLYRRAEAVRVYYAGRFIEDAKAVNAKKGYLRWLAGVLGERGRPPRPRPDGRGADFDTIDGARHSLEFDDPAEQDPRPTAARPPPPPGDEHALYEWRDRNGKVRISQGLKTIPLEFRETARRVQGRIGDSPRFGTE